MKNSQHSVDHRDGHRGFSLTVLEDGLIYKVELPYQSVNNKAQMATSLRNYDRELCKHEAIWMEQEKVF